MVKGSREFDVDRISRYLGIGIIGALIILSGDFLMGWGVRDESSQGLLGQLSPYLKVSDTRMFLAALLGFIGVPLAVIGHYGIYKLLKPNSGKYARLYGLGNLAFLTLGGAGMHVSSVEAAYFYKYMTNVAPDKALDHTLKFAIYFLLPIYTVLIALWAVMVIAHIIAVSRGLSPLPRWCWILAMPIGSLIFSILGVFGNHAFINAMLMGAFSLGNVWTLSGHLMILRKTHKHLPLA